MGAPSRPVFRERLRLGEGHELADLPELMQIAKDFDADGLVDPADVNRRKSTRHNESRDNIARRRIVRRIKQHRAIRGAVGAGCKRFRAQRAEGLDEPGARGKETGNDLPRRLVFRDDLSEAALSVGSDRVRWIDDDLAHQATAVLSEEILDRVEVDRKDQRVCLADGVGNRQGLCVASKLAGKLLRLRQRSVGDDYLLSAGGEVFGQSGADVSEANDGSPHEGSSSNDGDAALFRELGATTRATPSSITYSANHGPIR